MDQLLIGVGIAVMVGASAIFVRSRRGTDRPTQREFSVPSQIDRSDFGSPHEEWLVIVFTSSTCPVCADVSAKVEALTSRSVATRIVDFATDRDIHERYGVDAVPMVLIADAQGEVLRHVLGPISATDLWAAVASLRDGAGPSDGQCAHR